MDLAIDSKTGNRRDRATIRELLQMRACDKTPDTDTSTRLIREGLIEKLWLEKQGGVVSWVADFSCWKQTPNVIIWITTAQSEHVFLLFSETKTMNKRVIVYVVNLGIETTGNAHVSF